MRQGWNNLPPLSPCSDIWGKGLSRMKDHKRNYIKMTLAALTLLGILMLCYILTPIPVLNLETA